MHFIRALIGLALATVVAAAPPFLPTRDNLPEGCPSYCDCSQYTDFSE